MNLITVYTDGRDKVESTDDTNLFMSHKDPVYLAASLNSELNKLSTWFKANKLSLNLKKTNFMLFKPRQKGIIFQCKNA